MAFQPANSSKPGVLFIFWLFLKIFLSSGRLYRRHHWYKELGNWNELNTLVNTLTQRARENEHSQERDEEQVREPHAIPMQMRSPGTSSDAMAGPAAISTPTVSDIHTFTTTSDGTALERPWRTHQRYYSNGSNGAREDTAFLSPAYRPDSSPPR
jgi:hypothetical protein